MALGTKAILGITAVVGLGAVAARSGKRRSKRRVQTSFTVGTAFCQKQRKDWSDAELEQWSAALRTAFDELGPWQSQDLAEARELTFRMTNHALASVCPGIQLPRTQLDVPRVGRSQPAWWKAIYDTTQQALWLRVTGAS